MYVLKHYVFWGLLTLVLIGVVVSMLRGGGRNRGRRLEDRISPADELKEPKELKASRTPSAPKVSVAEPPPLAFDPSATRIHIRTSPSEAPAVVPKHDRASLLAAESCRLVCVGGDQKGNSFPVTSVGITVGRDDDNDIVIHDPRVSHRHAWIGIIDSNAVLRDLESTNGTFINAHLDSLVHEVVLSPGDTIFFGGHGGDQFRFVVD
ncbi:MAG: FHA domain-containing protein [Sulfuritalea sp.]|nr:FHA domain-containing protein [Sulfuritalea sp.]